MRNLDDLLSGGFAAVPAAIEAEYFALWQTELEQLSHASRHTSTESFGFELALRGGLLADRFAWVFIAGYQAALRVTFPGTEFQGWAAFAVSEDRGHDNPLPGVVWHAEQDNYRLAGYKTWVAAIDHVQQLVVKARGEQAGQSAFFLISTADQNLVLSANPQPGRLPDLSQGRAQLRDVVVGVDGKLSDEHVAGFAQMEALFIYIAFVAMTYAALPQRRDQCRELLLLAQKISPYQVDIADLARFDAGVQALRSELSAQEFAQDAPWQRDQQLIGMYSKGIQSRIA